MWLGQALCCWRNTPEKQALQRECEVDVLESHHWEELSSSVRSPFQFCKLPVEVQKGVVAFSTAREILRLCQTCRSMRSTLRLCIQQPFRILDENYWITAPWEGLAPRMATIIPIFERNLSRIHSITIVCEWCNRGFGGTGHSQLYIVAHGLNDEDVNFEEERIVAQSPYAGNKLSKLIMSFRRKPGQIYYLWYRTGIHQIYIRNVYVHTLTFDGTL